MFFDQQIRATFLTRYTFRVGMVLDSNFEPVVSATANVKKSRKPTGLFQDIFAQFSMLGQPPAS